MKRGYIEVSVEVLRKALQLPDDAQIVGIETSLHRNCFEVFLAGEGCPDDMLEGQVAPLLTVWRHRTGKHELRRFGDS